MAERRYIAWRKKDADEWFIRTPDGTDVPLSLAAAAADLLAALKSVSSRPRRANEWIDQVRAAIAKGES